MKTTQRTCAACNMLARGVKFRNTPPHTCSMRIATDTHQWVKDESYKSDGTFKARHVCKVCGCERLKGAYQTFIYSRGGMVGLLTRPDCVDFSDRETLNRID